MISDENLKQLREMMSELLDERLEAWGLKKPTAMSAEAAAVRMRRYRERMRNAGVTGRNGKRNASQSVKRNAERNGSEQVRNAGAINGEAVAFIPIIGGEFGVSKELLVALEAAYPAVDVPQTLLEIKAWCVANPSKRKTGKGAPRFINNWCQRIQDRG